MNDTLVLHNRLKELRTEKKISQSELADMVGVSRNTISSIEVGQFSPTAKLAYSLCIALDKKFEEVFYFEGFGGVSDGDDNEEKGLPDKTIRRIMEYTRAIGWDSNQILDFIMYLTKE